MIVRLTWRREWNIYIENWTVIGRYNDGGRKELQEFHREKHFVIEATPWKILARYYQKLHRVICGIPWQSGVFPD